MTIDNMFKAIYEEIYAPHRSLQCQTVEDIVEGSCSASSSRGRAVSGVDVTNIRL